MWDEVLSSLEDIIQATDDLCINLEQEKVVTTTNVYNLLLRQRVMFNTIKYKIKYCQSIESLNNTE